MSQVSVTPGTDAWLAERRKGVTASDAGVVAGVSRFADARALWAVKTGRVQR